MELKFERVIAFHPSLARELGGIGEAIFYQQILFWSDKGTREDGFIYKSKKEIEEETMLTERQQDPIRKKLVEKGWLEVKKMKANGVPTLHYKAIMGVSITTKGRNGNLQNVGMETDIMSDSSYTDMTSEKTTDINVPYEQFDEFWEMYPKKVAKGKCRTKWLKLPPRDRQAILEDVPRRRETDRWRNGYVADPYTYLNQERWKDDLASYCDAAAKGALLIDFNQKQHGKN